MEKEQWTKELFSDVYEWVGCKNMSLNYHLNQMHTGHGSCRSYLFNHKRVKDALLLNCGAVDTSYYTMFECERWNGRRAWVEDALGGKML